MTRPIERIALERQLDQWFADGPNEVADRVITAALLDIDTTSQRSAGFGRPWRTPRMSRVALSATAAAVTVVAVGAMALWVNQSRLPTDARPSASTANVVAATPAPSPTARETTIPSATSRPRPNPTPTNAYGGDPPANPAVRLPADGQGLLALMPDTLCGRPVDAKDDRPFYSKSTGPLGNFSASIFQDVLAATGRPQSEAGLSASATVSASGPARIPCVTLGVFRIVGADPVAFEHAFIGSAYAPKYQVRRLAGRQIVVWAMKVRSGRPGCGQCEFVWSDYLYFTGDAVFFFDALNDTLAEGVLKDLP